MSDKKLNDILAGLSRVEEKLDTAATNFDRHVLDDQLMAHEVRLLSKQRGFIRSSFVAIGLGIGTAAMWAIHKVLGHT